MKGEARADMGKVVARRDSEDNIKKRFNEPLFLY